MSIRAIIFLAVSSQTQADFDKVSLDEQERLCRQWCDRNGAQIVAVLRVDGYPRSETDIVTALDEFASLGVTAYADLRRAWAARSFDVLVAYHSSRLGRSQSLYTYVVENTIRSGAAVHIILGGRIDSENMEFGIAMGGIQARGESRRWIEMNRAAVRKRIERGLPASRPILSHRVLRDESGKATRLVVDENKRVLFNDAAKLILDGVAWQQIEIDLYRKFGHLNKKGSIYTPATMYRVMHSPMFWGHSAYNYSQYIQSAPMMLWAFGRETPPPTDVIIYYDTHEPMYTGDLAGAIKAELYRRITMANGRSGNVVREFSRLLRCSTCGGYMTYINTSMRCTSQYKPTSSQFSFCNETDVVRLAYIRSWLETFLSQFTSIEAIHAAAGAEDQSINLDDLHQSVIIITRRIQRLAERLADVPDDAVQDVNDQMKRLTEERSMIQLRIDREIARRSAGERDRAQSQHALDDILKIGWREFWNLPAMTINQTLHAVFGRWRLAVQGGQIIGLIDTELTQVNNRI